MSVRGEGSIFGRLAYSVGYALGRADTIVDEPGTGTPVGESPAPRYTIDHEDDLDGLSSSIAMTLGTVGAGWALGKIMKPRPINWPRAILAGLAATALSDLAQILTAPEVSGEEGLEFPPTPEDLPRYATGIATAAAYGAQIYPRLPGSPMTRGLIYGAVDASLSEEGGVLGLLERVVPQVELPLRSLALSPGRRTRLASIAFGLGLGLYSARPKPKEKDKSKSKSKSKSRKG